MVKYEYSNEIINSIIESNFNDNKTSLVPIMYGFQSITYQLYSKIVECSIYLNNDKLTIISHIIADSKVIHTVSTDITLMSFDGVITDKLLGL